MSSLARPRGRLPARVYWFRRLLVLGLATALVVGVATLLGGGGDAQDDGAATVVSGTPRESRTPTAASPTARVTKTPAKVTKKRKEPRKPPLAEPSGPCLDSDVVVTPEIDGARAGGDVEITLLVTTKASEACTFEVSPASVVLRLTSGSDKIWSSQQCQRAIPRETVVARKTVPGETAVTWHGHRSNDECSLTAPWAMPGYYHAEAAVLGGDPTDVQFRLSQPEQPTITPKPKIKRKKAQDD